MRKLIYLVAMSLDGFIAEEDGSFDAFPADEGYIADLFSTFPETAPAPFQPEGRDRSDNRWFDAVLMGRVTYEVGSKVGLLSPYPTLDQYVISGSMTESPHPDVELVRADATGVVSELKQRPGKAIWLCGGGRLASSLQREGLIDEIIVKVNPVLLGRGIPLFRDGADPSGLELLESTVHPSGPVRLHYSLLD